MAIFVNWVGSLFIYCRFHLRLPMKPHDSDVSHVAMARQSLALPLIRQINMQMDVGHGRFDCEWWAEHKSILSHRTRLLSIYSHPIHHCWA